MRVQTSPNVDISGNSNGHISVIRDATVMWLGTLVVLHVLCMLMCLTPPSQGQGHGAFELPTIAHNFTFIGLSPLPLSHGAQS